MAKDFDRWNGKKKELNESDFNGYVHEREVWWCALGVNVGVEADGKHDNFERPVLIVRKFSRDSVLIIPLTTRTQIRPYHVMFEHSGGRVAASLSQVRLISTKRLLRKLYRMDSAIFDQIIKRLLLAVAPE
jgi:mRNA interferase MazF